MRNRKSNLVFFGKSFISKSEEPKTNDENQFVQHKQKVMDMPISKEIIEKFDLKNELEQQIKFEKNKINVKILRFGIIYGNRKNNFLFDSY